MYGRNRVAPEKMDTTTILFCLFLVATTKVGVVMEYKIYGLYNEYHYLRYIGATKRLLKNRLKEHLHQALKGIHTHKCCGIRAMLYRGFFPTIKLFTEVEKYKWQIVERIYIKHFHDLGYNLCNETSGGEGCSDLSSFARQKMSLAQIGKKHPVNYIIPIRKRKIIAQKVRAYRLGKHHSETTKKKQRKATIDQHRAKGHHMPVK